MFGTLHTSSAAKTIDRIIDVFPGGGEEHGALHAVGVPALGRRPDPAEEGRRRPHRRHEIMVGTPAIRNLIREDKVAQMYSSIQTGQAYGMQTLDQNLQELLQKGLITKSRR